MRDAEIVDVDTRRMRRVSPRYQPSVWVRIDGRWREGYVQVWYQDTDAQWYAWAFRDAGKIAYVPALFRYDPETMKPKDGDQPPDG